MTRKEKLLKGLNNTGAEDVTVNIEHVLEVISVELAEKLAVFVVETESPRNIKKNSAIPPDKRFVRTGLARFNRLDLIKALTNAQPRSNNEGGTSEDSAEQ